MNRTTRRNSILVAALEGVMIVGQSMAADIRYQESGDYNDTMAVTGVNGWQAGGGGPGGLPGSGDTARCNWANNIVTLTNVAPNVGRFQFGVDESGQMVVQSGGKLTAIGGSDSRVGNNGGAGVIGRLTVYTNGEVNCSAPLEVGASATGFLTVDGGTVNLTNHLWVGSVLAGITGTIYITNGGVLNVGGNIGLGTINASTPSGGFGVMNVSDGSVLNLNQIGANSIQAGSLLDISGSGLVIIKNDYTAVISTYTNVGKITAYGGTGTVGIDFNHTNVGKTTLFAIAPSAPPPTEEVWNPAANPSGTGKWNEGANWTGGVAPAPVTKAIFNVVGAIPCTVTNAAAAKHVVMGDAGPGGTLIITNGGSLSCGAENATAIGYNSNALMVVENGGSVIFGFQLWIGLDPGSDGTLIMNGGTVSVANMFGLGWQGGKGTAHINGGTLNLSQWDDASSIQGASVLDIGGAGVVVINGDHTVSVNNYIIGGQITANGGAGTVVVDYNNIRLGKTTLYRLGAYVPPEQAVWNPAQIFPDINGLWNVSSNWTAGVCPSNVTKVIFNVLDAIPCTVTNAAFAKYVTMGDNGPGGTLIITNGGSLTCSADNWTAVGRNNTATMIIENGGSASFGEHLWVGLDPTSDGTFVMNGGTASVTGMFSCGWLGGKGTALINGGTLNLNQWHATDSIKGLSVLNVAGNGKVVINGDWFTSVSNFVSVGKITANGGPNVFYFYDPGANKTTISAVLLPAPRQSITAISVSGGNVTITYQTTHQHTYHLEGTPSLSAPSWTPVPGSTNAATGAPVTFIFPVSGGQMFYRTVSP